MKNKDNEENEAPASTGSIKENMPLENLRIIDAGSIIAGPLATSLLADFGAEVVTIEHPNGDPVRGMKPTKGENSLIWKIYHRNKKAITLDLSTEDGGEVLKDLVSGADILVENFRPGTMEKWGLGYEDLSKKNKSLIMVRISGFGQTGPYSDRAGFGRVTGAMGGMAHMTGYKDEAPIFPSYPLEDAIAGVYAAYGTLVAAYKNKDSSDDGQVVDLSMLEAILHTNGVMPMEHDLLGNTPTRHGNTQPNVAPNSVYKSSDGEYVVIPASNQNAWIELCNAMNREDLIENKKYEDNKSRVEHSGEINGIVRDWVNNRTRNKIESIFDKSGVIYSFVYDMEDIRSDDHIKYREVLKEINDEELGETVIQDVVPRLTETPGSVEHLGPKKGKHNSDIYQNELGYSNERLRELKDLDVI